VVLYYLVLILFVSVDRRLMKLLISHWVPCADVDLVVLEEDAFGRVLVEDNVEWDHRLLCSCEEVMLLHFNPSEPLFWVVLHR